jgi:Uri superfamily endonuclease
LKQLDFPAEPGTYGLLFNRPESGWMTVGRLGHFEFPAGFYLYVGSALGPGGLAGRLRRHLRADRRTHWHVDYLSHQSELVEIWLTTKAERREHHWAAAAGQLPGATVPVAGFGASDCRCPAHLYHLAARPEWVVFRQLLEQEGASGRPFEAMLIADQN